MLPEELPPLDPLVRWHFIAQWPVSPFGDAPNAQEPPNDKVSVIPGGRLLDPDTHVIPCSATGTGEGRRIDGTRRIEHLDEICRKIVDLTPAKATAHANDLLIIGSILQRSDRLSGVSVKFAILLGHSRTK